MFKSLQEFYTSEIWQTFRSQLIAERTDRGGGILKSDYSGNPIYKTYDIIAHHIKPITESNVNDFDISLNTENIMLVSHREHNEIHSRFGFCAQKKIYLVYGAPCSGKTTFVNNVKGNSDLVVDIDNIWECVTGGNRYYKPNALKDTVFYIRDRMLECVKRKIGTWERAYIIDGCPRKSDRELKERVYGVEAVFIDTDKNECIRRLANDEKRTEEQKKQWLEYINTWFEEYTA